MLVASTLALSVFALSGCADSTADDDPQAESSRQQSANSHSGSPAPTASRTSAAVDEQYAALLNEVVDENGLVRYDLLEDQSRQAALKGAIERMAAASMPGDRLEKIALLCNGYNANALLMTFEASRQPRFQTVKDAPGFLDSHTITVAGTSYTLNTLKDEIRALGDPRIHCALVWGAMSCPPLLNEPYAANRLDQQLNDHCRRWIEDRSKNRALNMKAEFSEIFNWHQGDFQVEPYGDYTRFVYKFAYPNGQMRGLMKHLDGGLVQIDWCPFDWSLNRAEETSESANQGSTNE